MIGRIVAHASLNLAGKDESGCLARRLLGSDLEVVDIEGVGPASHFNDVLS